MGEILHVLYTDFSSGRIEKPEVAKLAEAAIASVSASADGEDGISYLKNAIEAGIRTPLTDEYTAEILCRTGTGSLAEAIQAVKRQGCCV
jgi:hypothetical protein